MGERKIKISYKFTIDKIQSLKDRNRQLEENINALFERRIRDNEMIDEDRKEIMKNIDRINKLSKRFGIESKLPPFKNGGFP